MKKMEMFVLLVLGVLTYCGSVNAEVTVWAIGDGVRVDPVSSGIIEQMQTWFGPVVEDDYKHSNWVWNKEAKTIDLKTARNEYVSFQLVIETDSRMDGIEVKVSSLTSSTGAVIASGDIDLFREWYHHVPYSFDARGVAMPLKSGWYPDALIPMDAPKHGAPFSIPGDDFYSEDSDGIIIQRLTSQTNQVVWVDVYANDSRPAGVYSGTITVSDDSGWNEKIKMRVEVMDFTLPHEFHTTWEWINYGRVSRSGEELELKTRRLARKHRITISESQWRPEVLGEGYDVELDWTEYDRRWGKYLDGSAFVDGPGRGQPEKHVRLPIDARIFRLDKNGRFLGNDWPFPMPGDSVNKEITKEYSEAIGRVLREFERHFEQKGWTKTRMQLFPGGVDEFGPNQGEVGRKYVELARDFGKILKESGCERILYRIDAGSGMSSTIDLDGDGDVEPGTRETVEYFVPVTDVWNIHGNCINPEILNMKPGQPWADVWFYNGFAPSVGNQLINGESLGFRNWQWIVWKHHLSGLCDWEFGFTTGINVFRNMRIFETSYANFLRNNFVFPGKLIELDGVPVPSIRMKMMRRSNQDYEYFHLLTEKTGSRDAADRIVRKMVRISMREAQALDAEKVPVPDGWSHKPHEWFEARMELAEGILR